MGNRVKTIDQPRKIRTVLLIDDDVWLAGALQRVLVKNDFIVQVFNDGRLALEWLARERADLVITDIYMDHMDGMEVLKSLRDLFPKVKVIAMSGGSQVVDFDCLAIAKMLGAARTLPKPLQMDDLLSAINELEAEVLA